MIARLYERMGWNIIVPDLHAHGLSEGKAIGMGWQERKDLAHWLQLFQTDTMAVHSMGAATTMNPSGEPMPEGIKSIRFVEDCGYTSVWTSSQHELREEFGLPAFPLPYTTSLLCRLKYGWSFTQASPAASGSPQSPPHAAHSWRRRPLRALLDGTSPLVLRRARRKSCGSPTESLMPCHTRPIPRSMPVGSRRSTVTPKPAITPTDSSACTSPSMRTDL